MPVVDQLQRTRGVVVRAAERPFSDATCCLVVWPGCAGLRGAGNTSTPHPLLRDSHQSDLCRLDKLDAVRHPSVHNKDIHGGGQLGCVAVACRLYRLGYMCLLFHRKPRCRDHKGGKTRGLTTGGLWIAMAVARRSRRGRCCCMRVPTGVRRRMGRGTDFNCGGMMAVSDAPAAAGFC